MIARRYGKIVNISGTSGLRGYKYRAAHSSSKWALRGLTRTVALEAGPHNVNVNALHPGIVAGARMDRLCREKAKRRGCAPEEVYQEYVAEMALRRVTVARDIANAVLFLPARAARVEDGSRRFCATRACNRRCSAAADSDVSWGKPPNEASRIQAVAGLPSMGRG